MLKALPWKLGIVMFLCVFALGIACSDDSEPDIYGVTIEVSPDPIPAHIVDAPFDVVFRPITTRGKLDDENLGQGVYVISHSKNLILLEEAKPFYFGPGFARFYGGDTEAPVDGLGANAGASRFENNGEEDPFEPSEFRFACGTTGLYSILFEVRMPAIIGGKSGVLDRVASKGVNVSCDPKPKSKPKPTGIVDAYFTNGEGKCIYPGSDTPYPDAFTSKLDIAVGDNGQVTITQPETADVNAGQLDASGTGVTVNSSNGNERYELDIDGSQWSGYNFYTNTDDCTMKYAVEFDMSSAVTHEVEPTVAAELPTSHPSQILVELGSGTTLELVGKANGDSGEVRAAVNGPPGTEVRLGMLGTGGIGNFEGTVDNSGIAEFDLEAKPGRYQVSGTVGGYEVNERLSFR